MVCITGGIAEAFYGKLLADIAETAMDIPDKNLWEIVARFYEKYIHVWCLIKGVAMNRLNHWNHKLFGEKAYEGILP